MTNECEVRAEERRSVALIKRRVIRKWELEGVAVAFSELMIVQKELTTELNRLMFSIPHRRYLRVAQRLEHFSPEIDWFMRQ
jgi:hypothetical protein